MRVLHAKEQIADALEPRGRLFEDGRTTHRTHWNSKNVPSEFNFDSAPRGLYASYLQTCFTNDDLKRVMGFNKWLSTEFYNVMHAENAIECLPTEPELRAELFDINGSDTFDGLESPFLPRFGVYGTALVEIIREFDSIARPMARVMARPRSWPHLGCSEKLRVVGCAFPSRPHTPRPAVILVPHASQLSPPHPLNFSAIYTHVHAPSPYFDLNDSDSD